MVENRPWLNAVTHAILILGVIIVVFPVYVAFVASTQTAVQVEQAPMSLLPGAHFIDNYLQILTEGGGTASRAPVARMMWVSLVMAMGISVGKIFISLLSAFAIVYFRFPGRKLCFWLIFITLMLPVEVRITPTYEVMASLNLLDSWAGLILPVIASATATFLFRQFFMTVPDELAEAARMDGLLSELLEKVLSPKVLMTCFRSRTSRRCSSFSSSTAGTSTCGRSSSRRAKTCTRSSSASSA